MSRFKGDVSTNASTAQPAHARPTRWLCFELSSQSYAIELLKVQEVIRVPDVVPVRGATPELLGVINLRGQLLHVVDLARKLGFSPCDAAAPSARVVVLEERGEAIGLLVSAVTEVVTLNDSHIERAAAALPAFPCHALIGIARQANTMIGLIDGSALIK
jgi:purine-binding chemotaxis protein CheW